MKRYAIIFTAACMLVSGCKKNGGQTDAAERLETVVVAAPLRADVKLERKYSAKAVAAEDVEIRARVGGYLEKVFFKNGARVKKGDLLFKIDNRPYAAALSAAKANVKAAQAKIALAEQNAERARGLLKRNAISTELYQTREAELLISRAKLLEAKAAEENAQLNFDYTRITAPVSGKVGETFVDEGNLVSAHASRLARIVSDETVKIYFELNAADALRYRESGLLKAIDAGAGANVAFKMNGSGKTFSGRLNYYDNALGARTSSLVVRADVKNADNAIFANAYGDILVDEGVAKNALLVPEEAIGTDLAGRFVYVVDETQTVRSVPVSVGFSVGAFRVVEGLAENARVVVKGIQRVSAGKKVSAQTAKLEMK